MNNEQFRKLMLASSAKPSGSNSASPPGEVASGGGSLGSRQRANIPMTPRDVGGTQADFARQLAERNRVTQPQKKFKTSAPKGIKLGSGYTDRITERADEAADEAADDRETRLKALEESYKKEEIDKETFEKLRFQIAGGDLESTHLVKGLDFKLLQRIRNGEDVYGEKKAEPEPEPEPEVDVDEEFDQLEKQEVEAKVKDKAEKKKGQLSTVSLVPGKKRTRDQILAELKASREAAKAQQEPALSNRFRKIGDKQKAGSRIERDSNGREILIIVDEDGHEKRKVRKIQPGQEDAAKDDLLMPDKDAKPLGMEVPEQYKKQEEPEQDEDVDIFDEVGADYDPLAGMDTSDSESEDDQGKLRRDKVPSEDAEKGETSDTPVKDDSMPPPPEPAPEPAPATTRNYFKDAKTALVSEESVKAPSMSDPSIMAAIKKAATLNPISKEGEDEDDEEATKEKKAREERRKKMVQMNSRDDDDLDMGFGTSRFQDEEDFDDTKVKLSTWDEDEGAEAGRSRGGQTKRKRGPKKRKGDANNAADVLRVMEQRKK